MTEPVSDPTEEWIDTIFNAVVSDAAASGYFSKVNAFEPQRVTGRGLTAAVWVQSIDPLPAGSGLAVTTGRVLFILRMYSHLIDPPDAIDPQLMRAGSNLIRRYHDDFDFGLDPLVRNVDLLGSFGIALALQAGYLDMEDGSVLRTMDLTIPLIVNDLWTQNG